MDYIYLKLKEKYPKMEIIYNKEKEFIDIINDNVKVEVYNDVILLVVDNKHIAHYHIESLDTDDEIYETIQYYLDNYKNIIKKSKKLSLRIVIILFIVMLIYIFILLACRDFENKPTSRELTKISEQINEYFNTEGYEYDNYGFNYVDERSKKVIVGLLDNSLEEQERFRNLVIDSEYLVFWETDLLYGETNGYDDITLN